MKRIILATACGMLTLAGTGAIANGPSDTDSFTIKGKVSMYCNLINNSIDSVSMVDLTTTSEQTLGSYTYKCNNPGGFERTIESENSGVLSGSPDIPYYLSHGGGSGLAFSAQQLTSPRTDQLCGSQAFANGQTGSVRFSLPESAENQMAGTYSDQVTFSITAN